MILRREREGDAPAIASVHASAFARLGIVGVEPPEVLLVSELRASRAWLPELSIVALIDGSIAGHVVCSRAHIGDTIPVLGLGPLGVAPEYQGNGVGSALMHAVIAAADALAERLIVLLGRPDYYRRFGFEPASNHGIAPPHDWYGDHFQVRYLTSAIGDENGVFRYADAFATVE